VPILRGKIEDFAELPVRGDELKLGVEHRDALTDVIERSLQHLAIEMQGGVRIVEQLQRRLGGDGALAQQEREHEARGCRADGRRDQMLGVAKQQEIRRSVAVEIDAVGRCERLERFERTVRPEILRHRTEQVLNRDGGAPAPEIRCDRCKLVGHEQIGLHALDGGRLTHQRKHDVGEHVERQAPEHAMDQRRHVGAEQRLRAQTREAEQALREPDGATRITIGETRQEQRVGPDDEAHQHAAHRAARGGAPPEKPAEKRRRKLRDSGEGQKADGGKLRVSKRVIVEIGHRHDGEDGDAADLEQEAAEIGSFSLRRRTAFQRQRDDDVVRHHDRQCHAFHNHHRGRGGQAADEHDDAQRGRSGGDRKRQHIHVAVGRAERESDKARNRDGDHEQVDDDEIEREQPAGAAHFRLGRILHHADMELARQQHDREKRQQRHCDKIADRRRGFDGAHGLRRFHRAFPQLRRAEHHEGDEHACSDEGHQLDQRFRRYCQHQAVLVLGGVGLARAEQHREGGEGDGDDEGDVADIGNAGNVLILIEDRLQRRCDGFQLQRDVRHRADDGDGGGGGRDGLALAVAGGDEVGDRGDVLRFRQLDDAHQQRRAERDHQDRADIDREEFDAGACREADRAEERPGRTVDRKRQRIDEHAEAAALNLCQPLAIAGDDEQKPDVAERGCDHAPVMQHLLVPRIAASSKPRCITLARRREGHIRVLGPGG